MAKFDFYSDPAHGWVKVKLSTLKELGLENKISSYSYVKDGYAYLEEDSDASKFVAAMKEKGETVELREHISDKSSKIRSYEPYSNSRKKLGEVS